MGMGEHQEEIRMQKVSQQEIMNFVKEVVARFEPERIILFGSYASGTITPDSDVDLCVVMEFEGRPHQQAFQIRKTVKRSFPLDLLVRRPEDIKRRLKLGDFLIKEIMQKGKVLYERTGS
jgi:predicted nucleotidyltransferase